MDQLFRRVGMVGGIAAGLTALALAADVVDRGPRMGWPVQASLTAALGSWALMAVLGSRLRSIVVGNDDRTVTDLAAKDEALAASQESSARYGRIVETAKEGIVTVDPAMVISAANDQASAMLGYTANELVGRPIADLYGPGGAEVARAEAAQRAEGELSGEREMLLRDKDGTLVPVLVSESPLLDRSGAYAGQLGMITDLTELKGLQDELVLRSVHDPLTGLPNRLLVADYLERALGRSDPERSVVAVVSIDLDGFKEVNTMHGHGGGDQVLVEVSRRLLGGVTGADMVARLSGSEFVVVSEVTDTFETLVEHLEAAIAGPFTVGDEQLDLAVSMGVALGHRGDRPSAVLQSAAIAVGHAKAQGGHRTELFDESLRAVSAQRLAVVSSLRGAVDRREFSLRFQPQVSLPDGRILGVEALIRWEHPQRGTLEPAEFVAIAEQTGAIEAIGSWVIEEACRHLADWQHVMPDVSMSLNISARQLSTGTLAETVRDALAASGANPSHLALEITESILMADVELSCRTLAELRDTGVTVSIDDFGTGYSSLSYLNRFPVDSLKIDQSFVAGLPDDAYDTVLVEAVLAIGEALRLSVIAEGVETTAQAEALFALGCRKAQGYHFYRPLTAAAFEAELRASCPLGARRSR